MVLGEWGEEGELEGGETVVSMCCMREESIFNFFLKGKENETNFHIEIPK